MSYVTVFSSVSAAQSAPLRVLLRPGGRGKGSSTLAVVPYNEKVFDVLRFEGVETAFVSSVGFDWKDFRSLTDCHGCLGIIPVKGGQI